MEKIISKTPLHAFHLEAGAKMAGFAGYDMPIRYALGTLKEHLWCRESAGLFDVSHMGQFILRGEKAVDMLSLLTPTNFHEKGFGKNVYTLLMNRKGGIRDDLIASRLSEKKIYVVVNAACKATDKKYLLENLPDGVALEELRHRALMALQGPKALEVLQCFTEENLSDMPYMSVREMTISGHACLVSRSGYTGEDGFELSIDNEHAESLWRQFAEKSSVEPIGLAARDSLRLEAGFALYGHDLDETTTPKEACLSWVVTKEHTGFVGDVFLSQPLKRKRVGIKLIDKGVARENSEIFNEAGEKIGVLTSGGHSPTFNAAIGQAYVHIDYASMGTEVFVDVRGRKLKAEVHNLRFVVKA